MTRSDGQLAGQVGDSQQPSEPPPRMVYSMRDKLTKDKVKTILARYAVERLIQSYGLDEWPTLKYLFGPRHGDGLQSHSVAVGAGLAKNWQRAIVTRLISAGIVEQGRAEGKEVVYGAKDADCLRNLLKEEKGIEWLIFPGSYAAPACIEQKRGDSASEAGLVLDSIVPHDDSGSSDSPVAVIVRRLSDQTEAINSLSAMIANMREDMTAMQEKLNNTQIAQTKVRELCAETILDTRQSIKKCESMAVSISENRVEVIEEAKNASLEIVNRSMGHLENAVDHFESTTQQIQTRFESRMAAVDKSLQLKHIVSELKAQLTPIGAVCKSYKETLENLSLGADTLLEALEEAKKDG